MKSIRRTVVWALALTLAGTGCGNDTDGGNVGEGEIRSDAALGAAMQAIALDFARVLADAAPTADAFAVKGTADCPEGGTANWTDSDGFGFGALNLNACQIREVSLSGTLQGTLFSEFSQLSATLSGPLTISGNELNVQNLIVSASLPIMDATTFWEISATTSDGEALCAWSGGGPCENPFGGGGGGETTTTRTGGTCNPEVMFVCENPCFDICLQEEVAQFTECTSNGVCSCTCVNYNL
jgi:hypothetical protein